jgi:hypothetical protein
VNRYQILKGKLPEPIPNTSVGQKRLVRIDGKIFAGRIENMGLNYDQVLLKIITIFTSGKNLPDTSNYIGKNGSINFEGSTINFVINSVEINYDSGDPSKIRLELSATSIENPTREEDHWHEQLSRVWATETKCVVCQDVIDQEWLQSDPVDEIPPLCRKKSCWEKFLPTDLVKKFFSSKNRYQILKEK